MELNNFASYYEDFLHMVFYELSQLSFYFDNVNITILILQISLLRLREFYVVFWMQHLWQR